MRRNLIFALLSFAPLALGGVALADHDDEHEEHEEHEHHEHGHGPRIIIAPPVQPYSTPPGRYAPEDNDRYVPEDSDRPYGDDRYYYNRDHRRVPYGEPPPDDYRY